MYEAYRGQNRHFRVTPHFDTFTTAKKYTPSLTTVFI